MIAVGIQLVQREPSAKLNINPLIHVMAYPLQKLGWGLPVDYYPVHAHENRSTSYIYMIYVHGYFSCIHILIYIYICTHTILYTWLHAYVSYVLTGRRATFTHPLFKWSISGGINVHLQPGSHAVGRVDRHGVQVLSCPVGRVYWRLRLVWATWTAWSTTSVARDILTKGDWNICLVCAKMTLPRHLWGFFHFLDVTIFW